MSIFNSNDYNRGYQDGYNDAMNYKDKSYNKAGMSLKFAFQGKNALNSYCSGYDEGYRKGCEKRNQ